jgi:putative membrane protein insertion efficiency factor
MRRVLLALIRFYQLTFSYLLGRQCRFMPTCSAYAAEAIQIHGAKQGARLAWRRFCKCHPFSKQHGYDPVPLQTPDELDKPAFRAIKPNQFN